MTCDPSWRELYKAAGCGKEDRFSSLTWAAAEALVAARRETLTLPGEVTEVGVLKGGSLGVLARINTTPIHAFDTFEGFPYSDQDKGDFVGPHGNAVWRGNFEEVKKRFEPFPHVTLNKGIFPDGTEYLKGKSFCFVHCDVDLYRETLAVYGFFWPLLVPSGIILCDDYSCQHTQGAKRAVDEWCALHAGQFTTTSNQCGSLSVWKVAS